MIKKSILTMGIIALLWSCGSSNSDGFTINGEIRGELAEGTQVFLKALNDKNQPVNVDTTTVVAGKFSFEGTANVPEMHYLFLDKVNGNIPIILEKADIDLTVQKDSLAFAKIKGSEQNDSFKGFIEGFRKLTSKNQDIQKDLQNALQSGDNAGAQAFREESFALQNEAKKYEKDFVQNNPASLITVLLLEKGLMTKSLNEEEANVIFKGLTPEMKETTVAKRIEIKLAAGKNTAIGSKAPNFTAPTPEGTQLALNDVLGKVTIIDFWAAWCRPCRAENPNVVKVYNAYHDKGLNIIGVSLDRKAEDWKKAISDDGLTWNHVSNVEYFDKIAKLYNVDAIPATFILDENGVIIAKNLRGDALESKIAELLQ